MITQIKLITTFRNLKQLLADACNHGYGDLPPTWAIWLYLNRN